MKAIDVHPDELFDREQAGTLTADERARLTLHLGHCGACRLERQLCQDFADELLPAAHAPSLHSVVVGALQAAHLPVPELTTTGPARLARPRRQLAGIAAGIGLVLALGVGAAAAQIGLLERVWRGATERLGGTSAAHRTRPAARTVQQPQVSSAPLTSLAREPIAHQQPLVTAEPLAASEPSARAAAVRSITEPRTSGATRRRRSTARRTQRHATVLAGLAPAQPNETKPASPNLTTAQPVAAPPAATQPAAQAALLPEENNEPPPSANKLFELANAARHQGDVLEASGLYRELRGRFPGSAEARLSLAVLARMQLDRGEARSALLGFDAYLQTGDRALREEAMAGRALALARLGRDDESARAFEALQQAFPRSAYSRAWRERQGKASP